MKNGHLISTLNFSHSYLYIKSGLPSRTKFTESGSLVLTFWAYPPPCLSAATLFAISISQTNSGSWVMSDQQEFCPRLCKHRWEVWLALWRPAVRPTKPLQWEQNDNHWGTHRLADKCWTFASWETILPKR